MTQLSWVWIGLEATVTPLLAVLCAVPLWRGRQVVLGNLAGTAVIFGSALGLILREYVELDRLTNACLDAGTVCWPEPSAFTRFAVYAFVGLIEVFVLFTLSLKVEERVRRRSYSPVWQR